MSARSVKLVLGVVVLTAGSLGSRSADAVGWGPAIVATKAVGRLAGTAASAAYRGSAALVGGAARGTERGIKRGEKFLHHTRAVHREHRTRKQLQREFNQQKRLDKQTAKTRKLEATLTRKRVTALVKRLEKGEMLSSEEHQELKQGLTDAMSNGAGEQKGVIRRWRRAKTGWGQGLDRSVRKAAGNMKGAMKEARKLEADDPNFDLRFNAAAQAYQRIAQVADIAAVAGSSQIKVQAMSQSQGQRSVRTLFRREAKSTGAYVEMARNYLETLASKGNAVTYLNNAAARMNTLGDVLSRAKPESAEFRAARREYLQLAGQIDAKHQEVQAAELDRDHKVKQQLEAAWTSQDRVARIVNSLSLPDSTRHDNVTNIADHRRAGSGRHQRSDEERMAAAQ